VPDGFPTPRGIPDVLEYERRTPETSVLYRVVQQNLETFLASAREQGRVVPRFVERELRAYLTCGILAHTRKLRLLPFACAATTAAASGW
jgi:hypothetical protein